MSEATRNLRAAAARLKARLAAADTKLAELDQAREKQASQTTQGQSTNPKTSSSEEQ